MWWVMQSKPIGFGCYIWGARAPKTTIFSFFFCLLSRILSKLQLSVLFFATLFWCVCNSFLYLVLFFCSFYLSREQQLSTMLFSHPASHSHLGTAHCNYSPVQLQQSSWGFTYMSRFWRQRERKCYCYSFTFPKGPGIWTGHLPVTELCPQAITVLFIMKHLPCFKTTAWGGGVWFLWQNHSG